ncbi:phospholipase B1, membrane-associated-like [Culicoides brevitarsis]|uniref:phospholipase B1, membrane-associated-like n=1 Tax=Culicoides brevitarsis TaxID=469753 RepID=UPI00307B179E
MKLNCIKIVFVLSFLISYLITINEAREVDLTDRITMFDNKFFRMFFHGFRVFWFNLAGKTGYRTEGKFLQEKFPPNAPFPCNVSIGRSKVVPNNVNRLRPGDIKVIAAMGDSLTAANGATSTKFLDLTMENRGLSWCIGGQWDWRNSTTLPNILKVYNPKLVGYSTGDAFGIHSETQFNVAEIGAVSFDLPYMAKTLVKRIRNDPRVNFKKDWKMVTISIGGNDICTFICAMKNPESLPSKHRRNLFKAVKYLKDNMPRTFVNIVSKPKVETVVMPKDKPNECRTLHFIECSCWQGNTYKATAEARKRWTKIEREFTAVDEEVARSPFWRGHKDFAVVYQPWSTEFSLNPEGKGNDYSLVSFDCFHMSQKGNAYAGTTLYNNLLQRDPYKQKNWASPMHKFLCPTEQNPYIYTYDNS